MMEKTILFRASTKEAKEECSIAEQYFPVVKSRVDLRDTLVIARYSALPYYNELEFDLNCQRSNLINSYLEHSYIAGFDYYWDVEKYTPKTWFDFRNVPKNAGPFVLKGFTNSKKFKWNTMMYAETFEDAVSLYSTLVSDEFLGEQGILIRKYVKLKTYEIGINGLPFTNEWRFFFYKEHLLTYGFYWVISEFCGDINEEGIEFAKNIARIIAQSTNFFVLDIAQTEDGEWILIEVNDGQMSGLSANDPHTLYSSLKRVLD